MRASGGDGIIYGSVRLRGGLNVVAYRPSKVLDVVQAEHVRVRVGAADSTIEARRLGA